MESEEWRPELKDNSMNRTRSITRQRLTSWALAAGLLLLLISFVAKWGADAMPGWTEEQGRQLEAATSHLHALSHRRVTAASFRNHAEDHGDADEAEFHAAQQKYTQLRSKLDRARARGPGLARLVRWSGIVLIAVGVAGFVVDQLRQ